METLFRRREGRGFGGRYSERGPQAQRAGQDLVHRAPKKPPTAKLNPAHGGAVGFGNVRWTTVPEYALTALDDLDRPTERWILTFLEGPALLDPDLMRRVLDEHEKEHVQ